jgi:hypothetical protein
MQRDWHVQLLYQGQSQLHETWLSSGLLKRYMRLQKYRLPL